MARRKGSKQSKSSGPKMIQVNCPNFKTVAWANYALEAETYRCTKCGGLGHPIIGK